LTVKAFRATLLSMRADPCKGLAAEALVHHPDGLLVVENGYVAAVGAYADLASGLAKDVEIEALPGRIITPGFVDAHIHYPQVGVMAAWGSQLLDWLNHHTFPAERAFADRAHADAAAAFFLDQLLHHGTTTALVFCTVHKTSVEALFEAALARGMRLVAGKVLMDRGAPVDLLDTVEGGRTDTEALIRAYRGRGRLGYAITPRFAVTSSDAQLQMAGVVAAAHPEVMVHTHLSENLQEIETVRALFPGDRDYLAVYQRHGLVGPRSVFAHCVHSSADELKRLAAAGAAIAYCPSSNLLLGSGLFDFDAACRAAAAVALGTDVGGGGSFSLLHMMGEAYKVGQLRGRVLDPLQAFYLATLGGAKALKLDDRIGSLEVGKEADVLVLDPAATPLLARRTSAMTSPAELLFALSILGDDRVVERTYIAGRQFRHYDGLDKTKPPAVSDRGLR